MASIRTRPSRRRRLLCVVTAGLLLAGVPGAGAESPEPAPDAGGVGQTLGGLLGKALGTAELLEPAGLGRLRVPGDVRVLVISSGADKATFGDGYNDRLALP